MARLSCSNPASLAEAWPLLPHSSQHLPARPALQTLWRLEQLFGVRTQLKRLDSPVGAAQAAAEGARLAQGRFLAVVESGV